MSKEKLSPEKEERQEAQKKKKKDDFEDSFISSTPSAGHDDGPSTRTRSKHGR